MKTIKAIVFILFFTFLTNLNAQEAKVNANTQVAINDNASYYQQRGMEDARYELQFEAKNKAEEREFWSEQKKYETNLKKKNRVAYKVYIESKRNSYAAHYDHCNDHCHHSEYWYQHAGYYYSEYREPRYESSMPATRVNTQVGVGLPRVQLGIF